MATTKMQKTIKAKVAGGDYYITIDGGPKSQTMSKADALDGAKEVHESDKVPTAVHKTDGTLVKAFGKAPAKTPAKAARTPRKAKTTTVERNGVMGKIMAAAKRTNGVTSKELAAISGWGNAGWNTIMATLGERHDVKLKITKRAMDGSKRQINVFHFAAA